MQPGCVSFLDVLCAETSSGHRVPDRRSHCLQFRLPLVVIGPFPPKQKGRLPLLASFCSNICVRCESHKLHRNRKCSTVSAAWPHAHWADSATPIWCRYPFNRVMPVRSWTKTFASLRPNGSYNFRACGPGKTASIRWEYRPTPSGNLPCCCRDVLITRIVADLDRAACS